MPPDGTLKGKPAWRVCTAAPDLIRQAVDEGPFTLELDEMAAKDRLDWIRSERELMKLREETSHLVPVEDHREELAVLVKLFITGVERIPDEIERKCGLSAKQAAVLQEHCDKIRDQLFEENGRHDA